MERRVMNMEWKSGKSVETKQCSDECGEMAVMTSLVMKWKVVMNMAR